MLFQARSFYEQAQEIENLQADWAFHPKKCVTFAAQSRRGPLVQWIE